MRHLHSTSTYNDVPQARSNVQTPAAWRLRTITSSTDRQRGKQPRADGCRLPNIRGTQAEAQATPSNSTQITVGKARGTAQGAPASREASAARLGRSTTINTFVIAALTFTVSLTVFALTTPVPPPLPQPRDFTTPEAARDTLANRQTSQAEARLRHQGTIAS